MLTSRRFIVGIGQIPPPMDGLAYITSEYLKLLAQDHDVKTLNISPKVAKRGAAYHFSRTLSVLCASTQLLFNAWRSNRICYMPCQSDLGLVYTVYLLALARLLRYPTYLHHHNFGYINQRRRIMALALRVGGSNVVHIFLCAHMQQSFAETYWKPKGSVVISNAAFVRPRSNQTLSSPTTALKIGLLSNLNREKGLYLFLDLLLGARDRGLKIQGILAGPVREPEDKNALDAAQKELGDLLRYAGPVYGDEKLRFYESIDVFAFPTTYANEAQPTVLYEALAAGNLVIAYERGCIASQVKEDGLVIRRDQPFVSAALSWIETLVSERRTIDKASISRRAMEKHLAERAKAQCVLNETSPERVAA